MGGEPTKFFWGAFGHGIAKVAGLRGLAKLSRWDDRSKVALKNTLLPYLTALVEQGKIDAKDALALNRLANPVEYYSASTKEFAEALRRKVGVDPVVITELITQFQDNNPDLAMGDTVETLASLAKESLGPSSELAKQLAAARVKYSSVIATRNERSNYTQDTGRKNRQKMEERDRINRADLKRIAAASNPIDEASLISAINQFNALGNMYDLKSGFFADLRKKVPYDCREKYVQNVAALENLFFYWKFAELKDAKEAWEGSSAALVDLYQQLAYPLLNAHAGDLVHDGRLSGSSIKEISDLTGVAIPDLIIELIKVFARPDSMVSGSVWLAFATFVCPEADAGRGQLALKRLLGSEAAKLASGVIDGPWSTGLYPPEEFTKIAAGLVWRVLGSPDALDRWCATHCLRSFAKFGRWDILDHVVAKISSVDAGPFQAKEIPFFYMHARLWLLIALARIGHDFPSQIARYREELLSFVEERENPHVLMRHFASRALLSCMNVGQLELPAEKAARVENADKSSHSRLKKKLRNNGGFYTGRPRSAPKPSFEFHLDYDFHKYDVDNLSKVFGQPCWKVADLISEIVHSIEPTMKSMYESGGRESYFGRTSYKITNRYHTHGQQLGWHALLLAAGKLLKDFPVTDDWFYEDDPWGEWFSRYCLTRDDGLWLSDGTDRTPLDIMELLLERKKKELLITGDRQRILALVGLDSHVGKELVVYGRWFSADNVKVHISSALIPSEKAATFARSLIREKPMLAWVPCFHGSEEDSELLRDDKKEYTPWIVCPSGEVCLDEHDPYGVSIANFRPRLSHKIAAFCSLTQNDVFGRVWKDNRGLSALSAQAWGREDEDREDGPHAGTRLYCTSSVLKQILSKHRQDLLMLINLERYEKGSYGRESQWNHTVAVVRITRALGVEYFKGRVNYVHRTRY
jgi:hypothetical protein